MAKVHYTTYVPDNEDAFRAFDQVMFATRQKSTGFKLIQEDGSPGYILIEGHGLTYKKGYLTGGTITDFEMKNAMGQDLMTVHKMEWKVDGKMDLASTSAYMFLTGVLMKNDKVTGSSESDVLYGGGGRNHLNGLNGDDVLFGNVGDTLTGKLGSDTFVFTSQSKKVVVTDFDAVGGGTDQDYLYNYEQDPAPVRIYGDHGNTVLDYGKGHTITLLDVRRADVAMDDFKEPAYISEY